MDASHSGHDLASVKLETDQPRETVRLQRPLWLNGVNFWTVTHSRRHWEMHHDTFTASLVTGPTPSVRAKWHSRGKERIVQPGSIQLMSPGEAHRTTAVSEPASFFVMWWSPRVMAQAARELGLAGSIHFERVQLDDAPISAAMGRLHDAVNRGAPRLEIDDHYFETTALLLEHACAGSFNPPRLGRHHPSVRLALDYLHSVFADNVSLDDLSRETRLSKFHLARCFRESTGLAPHQYQKLLRLQAARRLIETGVSVRDAASRSGFADAPHLSRQFRKWLGVCPKDWARANRLAYCR